MDLRQMGEPFEKKYTQFSEDDIKKVTATFHQWQQSPSLLERAGVRYENIPEYCYSAKLEEIAAKDFSLVPSKYIEFVNRDENIDFDEKMKTLQTEFADLLKAEAKSKIDLLTVFKELGYEIE
jgi:type I restriction enzyme M protein